MTKLTIDQRGIGQRRRDRRDALLVLAIVALSVLITFIPLFVN